MKGIITQSNYLPWKGYFDNINYCDIFVVYDEMQYTKRDWRNRNLIKTQYGLKWLTIPVEVRGKYFQKIRDAKIADKNWALNHFEILTQSYKKAEYFKQMAEWIEPLYKNCKFLFLTDINIHFIESFNSFLGIKTNVHFNLDYNLDDEKTQRLITICNELSINEYYTGPAAKSYLNETKFLQNNISVKYFDYSGYPEYTQLYPPFEHSVSIIDLIFNEGPNSKNFMKPFKDE